MAARADIGERKSYGNRKTEKMDARAERSEKEEGKR